MKIIPSREPAIGGAPTQGTAPRGPGFGNTIRERRRSRGETNSAARVAPSVASSPIQSIRRSDLFPPGLGEAPRSRTSLLDLRPSTAVGKSELQPNGTADKTTFVARVARDGSVHFSDKSNVRTTGLGASFDLTDAIMRWLGDDPYKYEKLAFLRRTEDERIARRQENDEDQLREALHKLPELLTKIWQDDRRSPKERRQLLFELWDECADNGSEEVVRVGKQVRATILAFICARVPSGSERAFSPEEIDRLNEIRASHESFYPYAQCP